MQSPIPTSPPIFGQAMTTEGTSGRRAGLPRECVGVQSVLRSKPSIPYMSPFNSGMTNMPGMPGILSGLPRCLGQSVGRGNMQGMLGMPGRPHAKGA